MKNLLTQSARYYNKARRRAFVHARFLPPTRILHILSLLLKASAKLRDRIRILDYTRFRVFIPAHRFQLLMNANPPSFLSPSSARLLNTRRHRPGRRTSNAEKLSGCRDGEEFFRSELSTASCRESAGRIISAKFAMRTERVT